MEDQRRVSRIESEEELEIDLGRVFLGMWKLFRRLWWMVLLLILAGAALFTLYQRLGKKPLYASSATFTVETGNETSGTYGFYYNQETADQLSKTFPYVLESGFFRNMLLEHLGSDSLNGTITAETIESSNVVTMRVESRIRRMPGISWMRRWRSTRRRPASCWGRSGSRCWTRRRRRPRPSTR